MAYGTNTRRVFIEWERAIAVALNYGAQTGWKHSVRQVAPGALRVRRTDQRIRRRRCDPVRERQLGRHAT